MKLFADAVICIISLGMACLLFCIVISNIPLLQKGLGVAAIFLVFVVIFIVNKKIEKRQEKDIEMFLKDSKQESPC